jgi:endonuclease-8
MPEGDTIFRAARTLHKALAGRTVEQFESVFPALTRVDVDRPLRGRTIEAVAARGKHLLIHFSGDLVLRTHMRMHGSWHIYRPGERWQRPRRDMRIVIATNEFEAVAFNVPIAELTTASELERSTPLQTLGPDLLDETFDAEEALRRLEARGETEIADALLDQQALAGIGNVFKSEILFVSKVSPFTLVRSFTRDQLTGIINTGVRLLRANAHNGSGEIVTYSGLRRTTGRADPSARLWVYGRAGLPCRRCGTPISRTRQGEHARSTYWCERCQPRSALT